MAYEPVKLKPVEIQISLLLSAAKKVSVCKVSLCLSVCLFVVHSSSTADSTWWPRPRTSFLLRFLYVFLWPWPRTWWPWPRTSLLLCFLLLTFVCLSCFVFSTFFGAIATYLVVSPGGLGPVLHRCFVFFS